MLKRFIEFTPNGVSVGREAQGKRQKKFILLFPFTFLSIAFLAGGCVFVIEPNEITEKLGMKPAATSSPEPPAKPAKPSQFAELEQSIHQQVNEYRASLNLPPLKLDPGISEVSRKYSQAMASGDATFSHDGFEQRVETIAKKIDYRSAAENLAYNFGYSEPGKQAVEGWIKSPGHQKNMVGKFDVTGIGVAQNAKGEYYFTQIFIRRR